MAKWSMYDSEIKKVLLKKDFAGKYINVVDLVSSGLNTYERKHLSKYIHDNHQKIIGKPSTRKTKIISPNDVQITNETITETNQYKTNRYFTAISAAGGIMDIKEYCDNYGLDFKMAKSWKLVSHTGTPFYNIAFYVPGEEVAPEIDFLSIFKDKITPIFIKYKTDETTVSFDRAVYTDVHVAMDVNKDGFSLYDGIWDETEIFESLTVFVNEIVKNKKSDMLLLHELGDFMDGWDGYTTRGGHKLPQNMDNQKAFDIGLRFKIKMIDSLFLFYNKIQVVNICNDNHAGSFGYVVNSAFKTYVQMKYPGNIEVINQRKFIDHYIIGNRCFILTHGKDDKSLKFGFKPHLDSKQIEKIKNYIDEFKLWQYTIEFSKGDSHQLLFDSTSSTAFEYQNFGAFSPPSDWVKTNFKNTLRCFTTFNYYYEQKTINNYIFKK